MSGDEFIRGWNNSSDLQLDIAGGGVFVQITAQDSTTGRPITLFGLEFNGQQVVAALTKDANSQTELRVGDTPEANSTIMLFNGSHLTNPTSMIQYTLASGDMGAAVVASLGAGSRKHLFIVAFDSVDDTPRVEAILSMNETTSAGFSFWPGSIATDNLGVLHAAALPSVLPADQFDTSTDVPGTLVYVNATFEGDYELVEVDYLPRAYAGGLQWLDGFFFMHAGNLKSSVPVTYGIANGTERWLDTH